MASPRITRVIGAVNIGSFRISAMIAGISETGEMIVLGSGHRAAQGIKRGYVTDMQAATYAVRDAVERAEKMANTSVTSVWIGCSGAGLASQIAQVEVDIGGRRIEADDIEHLLVAGRDVIQPDGRMVLIDATGHELETVTAARAKGKLVLSGPGASRQVVALTDLLGAAPALKPQVREAEWVGNRRWNLTFKTGQVLALPEGVRPSSTALMSFARLDGINRLLGGKVAAFDMRASDRIYFRVPGRTDPVEQPKPKGSETAAPNSKQENN